MSLKSHWHRQAGRRQIAKVQRDTIKGIELLRRAAASELDHINVKEAKNLFGGVTEFGASSPLCSGVIDPDVVTEVHPYALGSPRLCPNCERLISNTMLPAKWKR